MDLSTIDSILIPSTPPTLPPPPPQRSPSPDSDSTSKSSIASSGKSSVTHGKNDSFRKHDLELRTVTTMLHHLTSPNFEILNNKTSRSEPTLKLLAHLNVLTGRDGEKPALMVKRNIDGVMVYVAVEKTEKEAGKYDDMETEEREVKEEEYNGPNVQLLPAPEVHVGEDVAGSILRNWNPTLPQHLQTIASLLLATQEAPSSTASSPAWHRLGKYALFASSLTYNRLTNPIIAQTLSVLLQLPKLPSSIEILPGNSPPALKPLEISNIKSALAYFPRINFPRLNEICSGKEMWPADRKDSNILKELIQLLLFILLKFTRACSHLVKIQQSQAPPDKLNLQHRLSRAWFWCDMVHQIAWESRFWSWILRDYSWTVLKYERAEIVRPDSKEATDLRDIIKQVNPTEYGISTDKFDTGMSDLGGLRRDLMILVWMRMVGSVARSANIIGWRSDDWKNTPIKFQVLEYWNEDEEKGREMMDWREVVKSLFPNNSDIYVRVMNKLRILADEKDDLRRFAHGNWVFEGNTHPEAEIACLNALAKYGAVKGINSEVIEALKWTFRVVSPTGRCCSMCNVMLIEACSLDPKAAKIQTLGHYSRYMPCSFPTGMPKANRKRILKLFRRRLQDILEEFYVL